MPETLVLVPHFWNRKYFSTLLDSADKRISLLQSDILVFSNYALITGFLGYSNILTLLEFIEGIDGKEVYFLGTAGSLHERLTQPVAVNVVEIHASSIFTLFSRKRYLSLREFPGEGYTPVRGVSVDLIQRETRAWLQKQQEKGLDIVEMELFPLRVFLNKPISALVVLSDLVTPQGIRVFPEKQQLVREFTRAYGSIIEVINGAPPG